MEATLEFKGNFITGDLESLWELLAPHFPKIEYNPFVYYRSGSLEARGMNPLVPLSEMPDRFLANAWFSNITKTWKEMPEEDRLAAAEAMSSGDALALNSPILIGLQVELQRRIAASECCSGANCICN